MLAQRYQWTPEEIDRMDPDFIRELSIFHRAQTEVQKRQKARPKQGRG